MSLFATKGYGQVTVGEIAGAVGIKAPSLYKHFKSKQDIFDAILDEMKTGFKRQAAAMQMDGINASNDESYYLSSSSDDIVNRCIELFLYLLHDENVCKFRRMLVIEQYNNRDLALHYAKQNVDLPLTYQNALFGLMVTAGAAIPADSKIMALQYYAPVFMYVTLCDCLPEREPEAIAALEAHFRQFIWLYDKNENEKRYKTVSSNRK